MSDDPLDIPPFLSREPDPKPPSRTPSASQRAWIVPPTALSAVARAVRAGAYTMQKIRNRTKPRYNDRELKRALQALIRSRDITREGRRYRSQRTNAKP